MARDTVSRTFAVAAILCVVCSVLVSAAAVALRPMQEANKQLDMKRNILAAAGLFDPKNPPNIPVDQIFAEKVKPVLIDLASGEPTDVVDPAAYEPREAARKPELSEPVQPDQALPGISRREKYAFVYRVNDKNGQISQVVFPVYGKGLWSTLFGFLAIDVDGTTVNGITFYSHAETPGLGGEVDNPSWKDQWKGKRIFDDSWNIEIEVLKGKVNPTDEAAVHQVDGLSGATITTRGVSNLVRYWMGNDAFGPYLAKMRGGATTATHQSPPPSGRVGTGEELGRHSDSLSAGESPGQPAERKGVPQFSDALVSSRSIDG